MENRGNKVALRLFGALLFLTFYNLARNVNLNSSRSVAGLHRSFKFLTRPSKKTTFELHRLCAKHKNLEIETTIVVTVRSRTGMWMQTNWLW